jgi:hypothetical protein
MHLLSSLPHKHVKGQSAADLLGNEPMLAYDIAPALRLQQANHFIAATLPQYDNNLRMITDVARDAYPTALGLQQYIAVKLNYENPPRQLLTNASNMIARVESVQRTLTGYEGRALVFWLNEIWLRLTTLLDAATNAKPKVKTLDDHNLDAVMAVGKAIIGIGSAIKEVVLMARDLELLQRGVAFEPASGIGKAYKSGKSTGEILEAMVDGIIDEWKLAFEHAGNGDFSKLMDLTAEIALDIAFELATMGTATPAVAAKRGAKALGAAGRHTIELSEEAAKRLMKRSEGLLAESKQALRNAPPEGRRALLEVQDTARGFADGLRVALKGAVADADGVRLVTVDTTAIKQAIARLRGARSIDNAKAATSKLTGPARAQGNAVVKKLEKLASNPKLADAAHAAARRIADGDGAAYVAALDDALGTWARKLDDDLVASVVRRSAEAVDPAKFLAHVDWIMDHKGLTHPARTSLLRRGVLESELDLGWLRTQKLPNDKLELLALDPNTNWKTLMKDSGTPSDHFPAKLSLAGTAAAPKVTFRPNPGGEIRQLNEALQIAERNGVDVDPERFRFTIDNSLPDNISARYFWVSDIDPTRPRMFGLKNFQDSQGRFVVGLNRRIMSSDDHILGTIAHEVFEIDALESAFVANGGRLEAKQIHSLINAETGTAHSAAWEHADAIVEALQLAKRYP